MTTDTDIKGILEIVGKQPDRVGNSYMYVKHYAEKAGMEPVKACLTVLRDVEQVLGIVIGS